MSFKNNNSDLSDASDLENKIEEAAAETIQRNFRGFKGNFFFLFLFMYCFKNLNKFFTKKKIV